MRMVEVRARDIIRPGGEKFLDGAESTVDLRLSIGISSGQAASGQRKFQLLQVQAAKQCHCVLYCLLIGGIVPRQPAM
jgi:hypothetical protein